MIRNPIYRIPLKIARKLYQVLNGKPELRNWEMFSNKQYSNSLIYQTLMDDKPCMIARFGSTEMLNLINYLGVKKSKKNYKGYIKGVLPPWWWEKSAIAQLYRKMDKISVKNNKNTYPFYVDYKKTNLWEKLRILIH